MQEQLTVAIREHMLACTSTYAHRHMVLCRDNSPKQVVEHLPEILHVQAFLHKAEHTSYGLKVDTHYIASGSVPCGVLGFAVRNWVTCSAKKALTTSPGPSVLLWPSEVVLACLEADTAAFTEADSAAGAALCTGTAGFGSCCRYVMAAGNRKATASFLIGSLPSSVPTYGSKHETPDILQEPRTK